METEELNGPRLHPISGETKKLVVLLHGYGSDGADLMPLAEMWQSVLLEAQFVAPNAPQICANNPIGYEWFPLNVTEQGIKSTPQERLSGAKEAAGPLSLFIEAELKRLDLARADMAIAGFSQGAMMALHMGLDALDSPAAIVSYSGMLLDHNSLAEQSALPPVYLAHGSLDDVVPFEAMGMAEKALKAARCDVTSHIQEGMGHGIDGEAVERAGAFLAQHLKTT